MTVKVREKAYKAITGQEQPFLISKFPIRDKDVVVIANGDRRQYALVTCCVRHKGEFIIGLKTYLGKAKYEEWINGKNNYWADRGIDASDRQGEETS